MSHEPDADREETVIAYQSRGGGDPSFETSFEIRTASGSPPEPTEGKVFAWVRITFEYPIEVDPSYLETVEDADYDEPPTSGTWHRSEGTWCADNFLDEIEEAVDLERRTGRFGSINGAFNGGCLDDFVERPITVRAEPSRGQQL